MAGVLRGLQARRPAIFNIYTPCQAEHGLPDHGSARAAKMALEGRAFAHLVYDPDAGDTFPERLSLEGNPAVGDAWPTYELAYRDDDGRERTTTVPMTTADWAATEPRFKPHFRPIPRSDWDDAGLVPFHEYLERAPSERDGAVPYILVIDAEKRLSRLRVSPEMVDLTEERAALWNELRELAGITVPESVAASVRRVAEVEFETRLAELEREHEGRIAELKAKYPALITRKIAEALVAGGAGLSGGREPVAPAVPRPEVAATTVATPAAEPEAAPPPAPSPDEAPEPAPEALGMDAWIETALCTSCDECIRINPDIFAYNDDKQAYVKDPAAGSFEQIVKAAEKCTARIIHPGTQKDPNEPNLEKWVARAEAFQ
jgi:pyruvate-ferredoxin/flavodoxin oxidoreductase